MLPGLWDGLEGKRQKGHYTRRWRVRRIKKYRMRYDVPLMNFRNITNKNNYLNIAKTKPSERASRVCDDVCVLWSITYRLRGADRSVGLLERQTDTRAAAAGERQAVRSLGPLRCACYQTCTRGLSTSSSGWDLDCPLKRRQWEDSSWMRLRAWMLSALILSG